MSDHVLWKDLEFGMKDKVWRRTLKAVRWMASGVDLSLGGRTIAIVPTNSGGPYFAFKADHTRSDGTQGEPIALGVDPDLGILYSLVKETSDDKWEEIEQEMERYGV